MSLAGTVWKPVGPSPMSEGTLRANGVTTAIAVNPSNSNIIYQGTAGGGLWRTSDGGVTWTPLFDRQLALGIGEPGAVALDPNNPNTLYVGTSPRVMLGGTGSFGPFGLGADPAGFAGPATAGVMKSTDGGASWIRLGSGYPTSNTGNASQFLTQWINVIIVDPANSNTLYLGSNNGVYRSLDGGQNWTQGVGTGGQDVLSLVLDTSSPAGARILYAGLSSQGVFRSTDGGQNWTQILSAATAAVSVAVGTTPGASFGRVAVDIAPPTSPPNPNGVQVLYVTMSGTGGAPDPVGVFLSTDRGANWTQRAAAGIPGVSYNGGYCLHMIVDPASPGDGVNDIIYLGTSSQGRSTDSGASFTATGSTDLHADTHTWAAFRQPSPTPSIIYCGNDGGIFRSTDNGTTWSSLNAGGLQTGLFYNIDVTPDATAAITVGTLQDNQVQTTAGGSGLGWVATAGGDGFDVAFDGTIAQQAYSTSGCGVGVQRSIDDGVTWTPILPPWTGAEAGTGTNCYMPPITTDPSNGGTVYVSGSQNLWQSTDGGNNWRSIGPFPGAGNVNVARTNRNNVVIAVGNQVFVSTNALAATVGAPSGVAFNPLPGLPNRNVARAIFDPNDPTVVYAVLGGFNGAGAAQSGHVFRTRIGAAAWTDVSPTVASPTLGSPPEQVDLPFNAIALDGADSPTAIYVGTDFGVLRSVDSGSSWYILDDIHIPNVPVTDLIMNQAAGVLRAATYGRGVFDFVKPTGPAIALNLQDGLAFGTVCSTPTSLTLEIFNVGAEDLIIYSVQRLMGASGFAVLGNPGTPLTIHPGDHVDFTVQYSPTTTGTPDVATIRIRSNDPGAPVVDLVTNGMRGIASLETLIANSGDFGKVCLDSFADEELTINNNGPCPLTVFNISSSSADFAISSVISFPLIVGAGVSIKVPIRFQPSSFGSKSATITVTSDDPAGPHTVRVSGIAPPPRLALVIADTGDFGDVCIGCFVDEAVTLSNSGPCPLSITNIASSSAEFLVPEVISYPLIVEAGNDLQIPIRFQPTSSGAKSATLTVASNDPSSPLTVAVTGNVPSGKLAVTGSTQFGGVELGDRVQQMLTVCNVGPCDLHVTRVAFKPLCGCEGERDESGCTEEHEHKPECDQRCSHFKLINNPFPATLRPGSCVSLPIQFTPRCEASRCCELVISSDDPSTPEKTLVVAGHLRRTLLSSLKCWAAAELREALRGSEDC